MINCDDEQSSTKVNLSPTHRGIILAILSRLMHAMKTYQMLIDGAWVDAADGKTFMSVNPATGAAWASAPQAGEADVDRAVQAAQRAFVGWSQTAPTERGRRLRALADLLPTQSESLGKIETLDGGKLYAETRWQAKYIADFFHYYAGCADKLHGQTLPIDRPELLVFTQREPLGVVAAVVPWNSQLFLLAVKLGPALAAGNTVVLKASEHAPAAVLEFGKLIAQAGIPDGVVNIITGHGEPCGRALTSHPQVARVSFTGGIDTARHIVQNTANNLAQVSLELGGKSPFIVFADADLDSAVNGAIAGIFAASGQSCVAGSRLYLHDSIADEFLQRLTAQAAQMKIGDPMDDATQISPLCTEAQLINIEREIAYAQQQGARLHYGGKRAQRDGWFYPPTIVECPTNELRIVDTELFGPVVCALRFDTEARAIELANDTQHGLAAGIFTRDSARSLRVARAVRAGIVWVNTYRVISPIAEFGGFKSSGYGRESGFQAMYDYTRSKTVWLNCDDAPMQNPFVMR